MIFDNKTFIWVMPWLTFVNDKFVSKFAMEIMFTYKYINIHVTTLALGSRPRQNIAKGASQEWTLGITFHIQESVEECERMNLHTPKWAHTLGVGVLMDSWIFIEWFQRSKLIRWKSFLYHWKALGTYMFKMGSHDPFRYLKQKLWPKERSGLKLAI